MNFDTHLELKGKHAPFPPSSPYWLKYDNDRLAEYYINLSSTDIGTSLHELAADLILEKEKLSKTDKKVMSHHLRKAGFSRKKIRRFIGPFFPMFVAYVNDAVTLGLQPEIVLYYSDLFFGTADAIEYFDDKKLLEIHDLKTGVTPAKMDQLEVYAALYCLQYKVDPFKINFELRIYQGEEVIVHRPESKDIRAICDNIIFKDKFIRELEEVS